MSYSLPFDVHLGAGMAGLTDLRAQITDTSGANVGAAIAGFIDAGSGNYHWYYTGFPDGFVGFVKFYRAAFPATILTSVSVMPVCDGSTLVSIISACQQAPYLAI